MEDGISTIIFWVVLIGYLCLYFNLAMEFYRIAQKKGYNEKKYFWYAFGFPIAGWLLVIALPDRGNEDNGGKFDELPEL